MRNLPLRLAQRLLAPGVLMVALALPAASASAQGSSPFGGPIQVLNATQLILNGSFEDPNAVTPSGAATWDLQSGANYEVLSSFGVIHPLCKNSPGAMYLAGFSGAGTPSVVQNAAFITQQLSIPSGTSGAGTTLDYWLYFPNQLQEHEELVARAVDVAKLPDPLSFNPVPWVTLATSSNQVTSKNKWIHTGPLSMSQFAGQTILLRFQARTDQLYPEPSQKMPVVTENGIYLDDVTMWTPGNRLQSLCF